jgi:hypothetical protein
LTKSKGNNLAFLLFFLPLREIKSRQNGRKAKAITLLICCFFALYAK